MENQLPNQSKNRPSIIEMGIIYKEWYTLKEACFLKGLNIKTAYNKRYLMPNAGNYDGKIGGRYSFRRSTILQWLGLSDEELLTMNNYNK